MSVTKMSLRDAFRSFGKDPGPDVENLPGLLVQLAERQAWVKSTSPNWDYEFLVDRDVVAEINKSAMAYRAKRRARTSRICHKRTMRWRSPLLQELERRNP